MMFFVLILSLVLATSGCAPEEAGEERGEVREDTSFAGRYVGYSWQGEVTGTAFEDTEQFVETILDLDENGVIQNAKMVFFVQKEGFWIPRQSGNAYVDVDFSVDPKPAVPGEDYEPGESMFTIYTADMMAFYAVAVDEPGVVAVAMVDPITRYQFDKKFPQDFDFQIPVSELTIGSSEVVPTIRTSAGGLMKPDEWETLSDQTIFNINPWSHVVNDVGILQGVNESSSTQAFLEALGVEFDGEEPQPMNVAYGYFGMGGWDGNYGAIEESLRGQDATEKTSLIDWSIPRYAGAVNEENIFGVDVESGATRTVQNSIDGISGATTRMSRESTSYQRALVEAGIINEEDVIVGRF